MLISGIAGTILTLIAVWWLVTALLSTPAHVPSSEASGLVVEHWEWGRAQFGSQAIVGTAINRSGREVGYAEVDFNLYDDAGNQVGSAMANIVDWEPGKRWAFEAMVLERNATWAKLKGITGW